MAERYSDGDSTAVRVDMESVARLAVAAGRPLGGNDFYAAQDSAMAAAGLQEANGHHLAQGNRVALEGDALYTAVAAVVENGEDDGEDGEGEGDEGEEEDGGEDGGGEEEEEEGENGEEGEDDGEEDEGEKPDSDPDARFELSEVKFWVGRGYNFRHMGKGKWALGLPAPGSMAMTAVRGPGADAWKQANTKKGSRN